MLPVASPQRVADYHLKDDYPAGYVDGTGLGTYQEVQEDYQQQVESSMGVSAYRQAPSHVDQQPNNSSLDLETFKHQKIQEFRQALDFEMERKRQEAQNDLEAAERERWRKLMDFEQAIQGEMDQTQQQQHVAQMPSPMHQQSPMPASRTMPQHAMVSTPSSAQQSSMGEASRTTPYGGMPQNTLGNRSSSVPPQEGTNMTGNSIQQQHQAGINMTGRPIQQNLQSVNMAASPMHHHDQSEVDTPRSHGPLHAQASMNMAGSPIHNQSIPRNDSPTRQQNVIPPSGYARPQQGGMLQPASPIRQRNTTMQQQGVQGAPMTASPLRQQQEATRAGSPQRQVQSMTNPSMPMQERVVARSQSPMRPTQTTQNSDYFQQRRAASPGRQPPLRTSEPPMHEHQGMARTASPIRQQEPPMQYHEDMARTSSPSRQQHMGPPDAPLYHEDMTRTASPLRQHDYYRSSEAAMQHHQGMAQTASPMRQHDYRLPEDPMHHHQGPTRQPDYRVPEETLHHQGMPRASSPMRQQGYRASEYSTQRHQGVARTASPMRRDDYRTPEDSMYHHQGLPRTASPVRQQDYRASDESLYQGSARAARQRDYRASDDSIYQGSARTASPMRHQEYSTTARTPRSSRERMVPSGSSADAGSYYYEDSRRQRYRPERSLSPPQSHLPPASPYHEPRRPPSRMANPPRQRPPMDKSTRYSSPRSRPPTVREMQEHFQLHRRRGREDIWRTRDHVPETFTFDQYDEENTYDATYHGVPTSKSAGVERTFSRQGPREGIHSSSTWNPGVSKDTSGVGRQQELIDEAEQLEREYAKLTGRTIPTKASALWNVKKMQEARRKKLEALTARVVQNRRRLAQEMQAADRPLEISFVDKLADEISERDHHSDEGYVDDSREEHQPARNPKNDTRDSKHVRVNRVEVKDSTKVRTRHRSGTADPKHPRRSRNESRDPQNTRMHHSSRDTHTSAIHRNDARNSKTGHLAVVRETEEPSETEEGTGSRAEEVSSSVSETYGDGEPEATSEVESSYEKESTTQDQDASSDDDGVIHVEDADFFPLVEKSRSDASGPDKHKTKDSKHPKEKHRKRKSKSRDRKGEKKAKDFVEKLREKWTNARDASPNEPITHTYSREDVLAALETGKSKVTLPTRDSKQARKNRRSSSHKLIQSSRSGRGDDRKQERSSSQGRIAKIAIKKSSSSKTEVKANTTKSDQMKILETNTESNRPFTPEADPSTEQQEGAQPKAREASELERHHASNKQKASRKASEVEIKKIAIRDKTHSPRRNKKAHTSSGISIISDLSESAYGVASHIGSDDEGMDDTRASESTTSVFADVDIKYSYTDALEDELKAIDRLSGDPQEENKYTSYAAEEDADQKKKTIKVMELRTNSVAEGFEVEEGFDLRSIYSVYSKHGAEKPTTTEETYEDTLKGLKALQELEKRLDEEDRRSVMPELLELTELHGWNINKVVKHFVRFFPQVTRGISLDELTWNHFLRLPVKKLRANETKRDPVSPSPPAAASSRPRESERSPSKRETLNKPDLPVSPASTREFTLVGNPSDDIFLAPMSGVAGPDSGSEGGWRSRIRNGASRRPTSSDRESSIDMSDVRSSLQSISRRHRHRVRRGYKPALRSLEERS